ncbi:hypothetical protein BVX97_05595 [bacterium E08(2017)]|nr:hypothetical protein BVX97_05595 [bacterium E08(2017)]
MVTDLNIEETEPVITPKKEEDRFIRRIDLCAFWIATLASFLVYFFTLPPSVTLEDSGELAVAGDWLGVPHPPGYPIWTMMAYVISRLFRFVTYLGQPNPAWSIALLSAIFGALAAGITAMLISRSGSNLLNQSWSASHSNTDRRMEDIICCVGGVVASLLFAFSPVMWSQAVIVEVYSLNAFFVAIIFLLSYAWMCKSSNKLLYLTAFIFGLGLTNYQVLLLAALPLVFIILIKDPDLFRDFAIVAGPMALFILYHGGPKGFMESLNDKGNLHLDPMLATVYITVNTLWLAASFFLLPRGRVVALSVLLVQLGLAFYIYMPIVSDLRNPPMNWGYPRTWQGFKHALSRGQYAALNPIPVFSQNFLVAIGDYLTDLTKQFYLPIALLGFLPFTAWQISIDDKKKINGLLIAVVCAIASTILLAVEPGNLRLDKIPVLIIIPIMGVGFMTMLANIIIEFWEDIFARRKNSFGDQAVFLSVITLEAFVLVMTLQWLKVAVALGVMAFILNLTLAYMAGAFKGRTVWMGVNHVLREWVLIVGLILFFFIAKGLSGSIKSVTEPLRQANVNMTGVEITAIFRDSIMLLLGVLLPPVLLALIFKFRRTKFKPNMSIDLTSQKWIMAILIAFLTMSILLLVLANPTGDLQDKFIQKVKFISSHALYAIWIGYGLIFVLGIIITKAKKNKVAHYAALGLAALLVYAPIHKNYHDPIIEKEYGGAEQNGHDFGWQFGNYQLRGANAIDEELSKNEEPLPNPEFPPEMTQDAIFFGGTDPGRFVPTYMIYSAQVRPDVYLITQNALADNTYLNVMRDLYGDDIWIPSQQDSAKSFQIYVQEVNAGTRPKNAELKIEGGRVQVSGALGVMEINGILCKMIFDYNNWKHDFYVEESYVIRWMYPYLTPHGLIMKINQQHTDLTTEVINNDMDFWDWYTRRLTDNPDFSRDIVAMKSFDKLRAALSGLYAARGKLKEAERAYQEARILYPLSPEATFRHAQEVLMRQARYKETREMVEWLGEQDPGNKKVGHFISNLDNIEKMRNRILELEKKAQGNMNMNEAIELMSLYQKSQNIGHAARLAKSVMQSPNVPPQNVMQIATIMHAARQYDDMAKYLDYVLEKTPDGKAPAQAYLQMAQMYASGNKTDGMKKALGKYLQMSPNDWKAWLDMAKIGVMTKDIATTKQAVETALRYGGNEAMQAVQKDPNLAKLIRQSQTKPMNIPQNLLGIPQGRPTRGPIAPR